jgi:hypothetical protein
MRMPLKATADITAADAAVTEDGSLPKVIKETMERINPEAAYFHTEHGNRACFMVFDLKDPSEIPSIAEPLFSVLKAKVEFSPVLNVEELQKGLKAAMKSQYETVQ